MLNEDLKIFRCYCGLTQEQTAEALGIDRMNYAAIENGSSEPSEEIIVKLAKLYNLSVDKLVNGLSENEKFIIHQNPFDNMGEEIEQTKKLMDSISDLSDEEKSLILMFREAENKDMIFEQIRNSLYENTESDN